MSPASQHHTALTRSCCRVSGLRWHFTAVFLGVFHKRFLIRQRKRQSYSQPWHCRSRSVRGCCFMVQQKVGWDISVDREAVGAGTCSVDKAAKANWQGRGRLWSKPATVRTLGKIDHELRGGVNIIIIVLLGECPVLLSGVWGAVVGVGGQCDGEAVGVRLAWMPLYFMAAIFLTASVLCTGAYCRTHHKKTVKWV